MRINSFDCATCWRLPQPLPRALLQRQFIEIHLSFDLMRMLYAPGGLQIAARNVCECQRPEHIDYWSVGNEFCRIASMHKSGEYAVLRQNAANDRSFKNFSQACEYLYSLIRDNDGSL